jgi:bile-acid 7alpha-dehydratase
MAEPRDLETRVKLLEDIEAIKRLKYRYLRCLDTKRWDELAETLTEDATTQYADGMYSFQGRDAIMDFLKATPLAKEGELIGTHHCHHPEIEMTSETTAKGAWALHNYLVDKKGQTGLRLCAYYYDEYVKLNGQWRIRSTGYRRIFEEVWDRNDTPSLKLTAG